MFTDTKNLNKISSNAMEDLQQQLPKSKGKLRKVWKPILRVLSLKSSNSTCPKNNKTQSHPNNVNLNNASSLKDICELSTSMLEEYASIIRKSEVAECEKDDSESTTTAAVLPSKDATVKDITVISSASIDKTPANSLTSCQGCIYGRNCQHNHSEEEQQSFLSTQLAIIEESAELTQEELEEVPVQFVRTDSGTFFWTPVQHRIDDDLLNAWLCQSLQQFPLQTTLC